MEIIVHFNRNWYSIGAIKLRDFFSCKFYALLSTTHDFFFEVKATVLIDQIFPKTVHDAMNK